jgi:hypothetical protein
MDILDYDGATILLKSLGFLVVLVLILRFQVRSGFIWIVATVLVVLPLAWYAFLLRAGHPMFAYDFQIFAKVGQDVWLGRNPYAPAAFKEHPFLNPPTALPLFAAVALVPPGVDRVLWTMGNALALCGLVFFAQKVLLTQDRLPGTTGATSGAWRLPLFAVAGLTGSLAVSTTVWGTFMTGQLSLLVTMALLAALHAQSRGHPVRAGLWLSLASIKVTTLIPFLLLFLRRSDRRTWVSLAASGLALTLLATPPRELTGRLDLMREHIRELQAPGQVNDYSFEGTRHTTMVGLDHLLYRLGFRDRTGILAMQLVLLLALTLGVAWHVVGPRQLPRATACSLVAAFSAIFLYHRVYDTIVLVIPLVYSIGLARATEGKTRWIFSLAAAAILLVLYLPDDLLWTMTEWSLESGLWGRLIQAVILPCATWCILFIMLCLMSTNEILTARSGD